MMSQILAAIGETGLQPAASLNEALAANDRIKFAFSLLQMALAHAAHPDQPAATLQRERIACGIDDPDLDTVVAGARLHGIFCRLPGAARIIARIADDIRSMAAPVPATKPDGLAARIDVLVAMVRSLFPVSGIATGYSRRNARYSRGRAGRCRRRSG